MSTSDIEDCLSYGVSNYQLTASDENYNFEVDGSFEDLYEGIDISCKINRRIRTSGRQKYANLDPASMGVDVDLKAAPLLTDTQNILNPADSVILLDKDTLKTVNNGNSDLDSNYNKDMGKRSSFLDYYISLEASSCTEKQPSVFECVRTSPKLSTLLLEEKLPGTSKLPSFPKPTESTHLPSGWEKHEDDTGPYYWHISSGTIQRDPPTSNKSAKNQICLNSCEISSNGSILNDIPIHGIQMNDRKFKRRSCPTDVVGSCSLAADKRPIRFAVRSLGWVEIEEADLTPERSSKAVNKCIVDLSIGRNDVLDVVGRWGDGKDLFMDLDHYSLRLMDTQDMTVLNTQPIHTIRVWGVGRDNGRDFAYVARDRITKKYMCHVFRCDIPARIIANTLRDICKKIMIERSHQSNNRRKETTVLMDKEVADACHAIASRPTNLPMNQQLLHCSESQSSCSGQLFPTPMDEPKKVLKVHYLGSINVMKATGVEVLNDAIEQMSVSVSKTDYKFVNVAVAPSTITVYTPEDNEHPLAECRVRFLSFLGIGKNVKNCGFIMHTAKDEFTAHVFYCEPSSGALCKTIEAACKLRYQKCLDAHRQDSDCKLTDDHKKGLKTALKSVFGTLFSTRLGKSLET